VAVASRRRAPVAARLRPSHFTFCRQRLLFLSKPAACHRHAAKFPRASSLIRSNDLTVVSSSKPRSSRRDNKVPTPHQLPPFSPSSRPLTGRNVSLRELVPERQPTEQNQHLTALRYRSPHAHERPSHDSVRKTQPCSGGLWPSMPKNRAKPSTLRHLNRFDVH